MSKTSVNRPSGDDQLWFGHPPQLARLFTTEMWERFGFYGMRAILAIYLSKHFLFGDHTSNGLYGAFTSLVYLTPLIGGMLADRYLGSKRSVKLGAIMMAIGYFGLCYGGQEAKPKLIVRPGATDSLVYDVTVEKVDNKPRQSVVIEGTKYELGGREDGSLVLTAEGASAPPPIVYAKGSFRANGERDPFWVNVLFLSLASVIVGNGFFKPNISTIVGSLYAPGDARRDSGFTIFYMGINLGSALAQLLCPYLQETYGWWAGFSAAAFGMALSWSLIQFDAGRLKGYGNPPPGATARTTAIIYLGAILAIPCVWFLLHNTMVSAEAASIATSEGTGVLGYLAALPVLGKILFAVFLVSTIGIPLWAFAVGSRQEAQKLIVAIVLIVFSVVFWMLFEQAGSSLTFYADRNTDRRIWLGFATFEMPAAQIQVFNALFVVMLAPVMSWLWQTLAKRGLEPSIPVKFSVALMLVGLGFLALVFGARFADSNFKVGLMWLVLAYFVHSIGELCLSPVGLSMITKLSMPRIVGLMMGVWFLSSSVAQYVAGVVAQVASVETVAGQVTNPELALKTYLGVFQMIGMWGIGFGLALLVAAPFLKRMMHGVR